MNIEDDNSREDKLKRLSAAVDALSLPSQPLHSLNSFTKRSDHLFTLNLCHVHVCTNCMHLPISKCILFFQLYVAV